MIETCDGWWMRVMNDGLWIMYLYRWCVTYAQCVPLWWWYVMDDVHHVEWCVPSHQNEPMWMNPCEWTYLYEHIWMNPCEWTHLNEPISKCLVMDDGSMGRWCVMSDECDMRWLMNAGDEWRVMHDVPVQVMCNICMLCDDGGDGWCVPFWMMCTIPSEWAHPKWTAVNEPIYLHTSECTHVNEPIWMNPSLSV